MENGSGPAAGTDGTAENESDPAAGTEDMSENGTDPAAGTEGMAENGSGPEAGTEGMSENDAGEESAPGADPQAASAEDGADSMQAAGLAEAGTEGAPAMDMAAGAGSESAYSGYVMLPNGVEFQDLELEIIPDSDVSSEGTLEYRYAGTLMGSARAVLSQSYLEKRLAGDGESGEPEAKTKSRDSQKDEGIKGIISEKTLVEKCIIGGGGILLVILIVAFVRLLNKQK